MSGSDASSPEMPGFPLSRRPAMPLDESVLDALLTGRSLPPDAPCQARAVADMLASLADPAVPGALAGEAAARRAFARAASPASTSRAGGQHRRQAPRRLPAALTTRLAAAAMACIVALGGVAAAAYAGALPAAIQDFAHRVIDAPAAQHHAPNPPGQQRPDGSATSPQGRATGSTKPAAHPTPRPDPTPTAHPTHRSHPAPRPHPTPKPPRPSPTYGGQAPGGTSAGQLVAV
jgi:hypothetical protein